MLIICTTGSILLFGAEVLGQTRTDRFPSYHDLVLSLLLPWAVYAVLMLFLWLMTIIFPVLVNSKGVKCYNQQCIYKTVAWDEITEAYPVKLYGLKYIFVESERLASPLTIPLYLADIDEFKNKVTNYAGTDNKLSEALNNAT